MRVFIRSLAVLAAVAAGLSGVTPPRSRAFAIDGPIQNPANGHWYRLFPSQYLISWTTCSANAATLGGYLATTTSAQEANWVGSTFNLATNGPFFVGGTDMAVEGTSPGRAPRARRRSTASRWTPGSAPSRPRPPASNSPSPPSTPCASPSPSVTTGAPRGGDWETKKPGVFRLR